MVLVSRDEQILNHLAVDLQNMGASRIIIIIIIPKHLSVSNATEEIYQITNAAISSLLSNQNVAKIVENNTARRK